MLVHHSFLKIVQQQKIWCSRKKCFLNTKSAINYNYVFFIFILIPWATPQLYRKQHKVITIYFWYFAFIIIGQIGTDSREKWGVGVGGVQDRERSWSLDSISEWP